MKNFIIRVYKKLGLLQFINLNGINTINGKKVIVPVLGGIGIDNLQVYDEWLTAVLIKLRPYFKGTFLDIGVNLGQTLIKAYSVFDKVEYIGFEPNSNCVSYAQEVIALNKYKNCTLIPAGISSESQVIKLNFYSDVKNDQSASIIEQFRPDQEIHHSVYVPVFEFSKLKHILNNNKHGILKIDVEGAELEVLEGLIDWIRECQPIILVEVLPVYKKENLFRLQRQEKMQNILQSLAYRISRINKNTIKIEDLDEIGVHANIDDSDYMFYPAVLKESLHKTFSS